MEYRRADDQLFGKYCYIDTPWIAGKHTIYRIIRSGVRSNSWCEVPINGLTKKINHGEHMEDIVFVVLDTLIDEDAEIIRVALKDIEIIGEDEQTENSSEKPNNCKDEPQTDRSMAVGKRSDATADKYHLYGKTTTDEPQTCDTCKHKGKYAYCRLCGRLSENNYEPQTEKLPLHLVFEMALDECKGKHKGCENCDMDCMWRDEQSGKE